MCTLSGLSGRSGEQHGKGYLYNISIHDSMIRGTYIYAMHDSMVRGAYISIHDSMVRGAYISIHDSMVRGTYIIYQYMTA